MDFLSFKQTATKTGFSRSTLYRLERDDPTFPKAVAISEGRRAFVEAEVEDWMKARIAERDAELARRQLKVAS